MRRIDKADPPPFPRLDRCLKREDRSMFAGEEEMRIGDEKR